MRPLRNVFCIAALFVALGTAQSHADIIIPEGLNVGDTYHLVFVTSGTRDATSTSIADYNLFVNQQSNLDGAVTKDWGVNWYAIGSTLNANAKANALVSAPVYLLDGTTLVATGFADMWDKTLAAPINLTQHLTAYGSSVFTGSDAEGVAVQGKHLGAGDVTVGFAQDTDARWANSGLMEGRLSNRFYALSQVLIVPVPEPSTMVLWACLGCVALFTGIRGRGGEGRSAAN